MKSDGKVKEKRRKKRPSESFFFELVKKSFLSLNTVLFEHVF